MQKIYFGLMLRAMWQEKSLTETWRYNTACLERLPDSFQSIWLEDHLQWQQTDVFECWTTLSYLAATYPRFQIGSMVLGQAYRQPALLAKMAATLQFLSGGRLILGLGAGWKEDEYRSYGYTFPETAGERIVRLEEAIQIITAMWHSQPANFEGRYYQVHDAYCAPQPDPAIPLLLGGGGEKKTLALVARYANWWNFNSVASDAYARKLEILAQHCEREGRKLEDITLTYLGTASVSRDPSQVVHNPEKHYIAGTPDEAIREIESFAHLGVKHFIFRFLNLENLDSFIQDVVPYFR